MLDFLTPVTIIEAWLRKTLTDKQLVEANGGVAEVQAFCGFAVPSAVANWFLEGRKMPRMADSPGKQTMEKMNAGEALGLFMALLVICAMVLICVATWFSDDDMD